MFQNRIEDKKIIVIIGIWIALKFLLIPLPESILIGVLEIKYSYIFVGFILGGILYLIKEYKNDLYIFNFDKASLLIVLIAASYWFVNIFQVFLSYEMIIVIWLAISTFIWFGLVMYKEMKWFNTQKIIWLLLAFIIPLIWGIVLRIPAISFLRGLGPLHDSEIAFVLNIVGEQFIMFLLFVSAIEEPLFRGFLWGFLKKLGFEDSKTLLIQTLFFWIVHIDQVTSLSGILPFVLLLVISYLLGYFVWKSRSLIPSMIAHAVFLTVSFEFDNIVRIFL